MSTVTIPDAGSGQDVRLLRIDYGLTGELTGEIHPVVDSQYSRSAARAYFRTGEHRNGLPRNASYRPFRNAGLGYNTFWQKGVGALIEKAHSLVRMHSYAPSVEDLEIIEEILARNFDMVAGTEFESDVAAKVFEIYLSALCAELGRAPSPADDFAGSGSIDPTRAEVLADKALSWARTCLMSCESGDGEVFDVAGELIAYFGIADPVSWAVDSSVGADGGSDDREQFIAIAQSDRDYTTRPDGNAKLYSRPLRS